MEALLFCLFTYPLTNDLPGHGALVPKGCLKGWKRGESLCGASACWFNSANVCELGSIFIHTGFFHGLLASSHQGEKHLPDFRTHLVV